MNVLLHKEIFNGSVSQADVSYLIQTIIRKKHSILLDADDMEDITWLNDSDRMIIEDSFAAALSATRSYPTAKSYTTLPISTTPSNSTSRKPYAMSTPHWKSSWKTAPTTPPSFLP